VTGDVGLPACARRDFVPNRGKPRDLVMWHNHTTMHLSPYHDRDAVCGMRRSTVRGEERTAGQIHDMP